MTAGSAPRTRELREIAAQVAAGLPPVAVEIVLTGSVSRGVADDLSDVEMLVVTDQPLDLADCFAYARAIGFGGIDTWGPQGTEVSRVFGYYERVPIELTWWPRMFAEASVTAMLAGEPSSADGIANGVALRTTGLLHGWKERLGAYAEELATARIEDAALTWGGFHPTGFLTLARRGERLAVVEQLLDDASRVLRIVYALNRVWQPTSKRVASRVHALPVTPARPAERIEEALREASGRS